MDVMMSNFSDIVEIEIAREIEIIAMNEEKPGV